MSHHVEIWLAHNELPAQCCFCKKSVERLGRGVTLGVVHHLDHDHDNNEITNLGVAHHQCHNEHHANARWADPSSRTRHSEKMRQWWAMPGVRERMSARLTEVLADPDVRSRRGEALSASLARPEMRVRWREAQQTKSVCPHCKKEYNPVWMTRHKTAGKCA